MNQPVTNEPVKCCEGIYEPRLGWMHSPDCPHRAITDCRLDELLDRLTGAVMDAVDPILTGLAQAEQKHAELQRELLAAARELASVSVLSFSEHFQTIFMCNECRQSTNFGTQIPHAKSCRAGRVLQLIAQIEALQATAGPLPHLADCQCLECFKKYRDHYSTGEFLGKQKGGAS